jgi:hypothetical protein
MMKTCPKCSKDLQLNKFNKSNRRDGYQTYCRDCHNFMQREKYKNDPQQKVKRQKREAIRKAKKPLAKKDAELQRLYGITVNQYLDILSSQNGVCKICYKKCKTKSRLSVDHDHNTGRVRGLLCNRCNRALGMFEDDTELLLSAVAYLLDK